MNNSNPSHFGSNRRNFIKTLGALGAGLAAIGTARTVGAASGEAVPSRPTGARYMGGFAAPKLEKVRWGVIGVGARGTPHVKHLAAIEGSSVVAICDLYEDWAKRSANNVVKAGKPRPEIYFGSPTKYHELLARPDVDAVIIATPWADHAPMAIAAIVVLDDIVSLPPNLPPELGFHDNRQTYVEGPPRGGSLGWEGRACVDP